MNNSLINNDPYVSVIIPTYHDWERLILCINALKKQTYNTAFFEVIIVNNDPDDMSPLSGLPENVQIISESQSGSYAARNAALAIAKGDIVAFTDSDCIPDKNWITNAVEHLLSGAERVAGRVELFFEAKKLTLIEVYEKALAFDQVANSKQGASVTANMITWRKHFDSVGFFNSTLMSGGDMEWGWRARDFGIGIVYASNTVVQHPARRDFSAFLQKLRRVSGGEDSYANTFSFLRRCFTPPVRLFLRAWNKKGLSFREKFIVMLLICFFKVYSSQYKIQLKLKLRKIERL